MHLTILAVPDCPNAPVLESRLAAVLTGRADVSVSHELITMWAKPLGGGCTARPPC